jgi:hypothetical protein
MAGAGRPAVERRETLEGATAAEAAGRSRGQQGRQDSNLQPRFWRLETFGRDPHSAAQRNTGRRRAAGFIEPIVNELPLEYAVEMNRLIQIQMEGSLG